MKKLTYILSFFISVFLYTSCDLLDLSPEDYYGSSNFWNNEAQVAGYMNGLHADLRGRYDMFYVLGETRGGTLKHGTSSLNTSIDYSSPFKDNEFSKDKTGISNWYGLYASIMQLNHFIQKVENECGFLTEAQKKQYLGQAFGLRSLYYFMLYKTYGGVPLITDVKILDGKVSADKLYTARSTPEQILNFIKDDVKRSEDSFGASTLFDSSMWSLSATKMLKADVYLWSAKVTTGDHSAGGNADLQIAKTTLQSLIGKFELQKDFTTVFSKKGNKEIIFAIRFKDTEATNWASAFLYSKDMFVDQKYSRDGQRYGDVLDLRGNGLLRHEYKEALWRSYDEEDTRRDKTFLDFYADNKQNKFGCVMLKGIGIINSNANRVYESDIVVYRYADVLLMLAEIENSLGGDVTGYINEVRQRAYGDNWQDKYKFVSRTFAENELDILHERDKEFVWEGKRWFDVIRMQDAAKKPLAFSKAANYPNTYGDDFAPLLMETEAYKLLWPVNVSTLNDDPLLVQTPGYEEK
ncbi:MAG: RagB/SusD family nutrient uptake outer membrane protein [Bacteroides sp.]|uniref:RagB/SusD family nutrient uptake outer membrane protein n=1 Tax=Bacteroides sp. TaxID=29523 RepID=UPI001B4EDAB2|nr:RagB/SusD family nutrient uptake outer membrane protein [Bacteroides sp.]MBP8090600.1 RagB/SusD family nutrient uptake outer membrane protein [Phocaeicola sp.]MBP6065896.1 RagB/SusD family nutrient uptake outer membrane protein [Bacteroides sp.]MBP6067843.1 RagB/SusD family nutrient uptake outer membrane protein [Bacteroides sp.]MBP8622873.1 RagB/SusD family nutrient uptake outer membrane protein [Bacteroides sp.]MBP9586961.1 RagB/SusD family nutrient uptake outer membrane protein [Bacteroi